MLGRRPCRGSHIWSDAGDGDFVGATEDGEGREGLFGKPFDDWLRTAEDNPGVSLLAQDIASDARTVVVERLQCLGGEEDMEVRLL